MTQITALALLPKSMQAEPESALPTDVSFAPASVEDLCLAKCIERALRETGRNALRDIQVYVSARVVRLIGRVPTYFLKQIAQETARNISGTRQIRNEVDVK